MLRHTQRRGLLYLLVILPDQSRSLIPADWTNWVPTSQSIQAMPDQTLLGSVSDLLQLRSL
ncbi:MAG: hypothetical protein ACRERU_18230, partial [Methylococcales bacterium]